MTINSHPDCYLAWRSTLDDSHDNIRCNDGDHVDRHFFHKKMTAGYGGRGYDELYCYNGDHDGRHCFFNTKCLQVGSDDDHYMAITTWRSRRSPSSFIRNACRWGLMLITAVMMAITTIAKFFKSKWSQVGPDDDHYYHVGDHDGRPCSLIRNASCRWGLMLIITVMIAITTIAKFFKSKWSQVGPDDDHYCHDGDHDDREVLSYEKIAGGVWCWSLLSWWRSLRSP